MRKHKRTNFNEFKYTFTNMKITYQQVKRLKLNIILLFVITYFNMLINSRQVLKDSIFKAIDYICHIHRWFVHLAS